MCVFLLFMAWYSLKLFSQNIRHIVIKILAKLGRNCSGSFYEKVAQRTSRPGGMENRDTKLNNYQKTLTKPGYNLVTTWLEPVFQELKLWKWLKWCENAEVHRSLQSLRPSHGNWIDRMWWKHAKAPSSVWDACGMTSSFELQFRFVKISIPFDKFDDIISREAGVQGRHHIDKRNCLWSEEWIPLTSTRFTSHQLPGTT